MREKYTRAVQNQHAKFKLHAKTNSKTVQNKSAPNLFTEFTEMDRKNFYHWGATCEIMDIIRKRNNRPETRRLVEQRNLISRPGTLRRRYYHQTQRTVFAPTRSNKRRREEIAEKDAEQLWKANRVGGRLSKKGDGYGRAIMESEQGRGRLSKKKKKPKKCGKKEKSKQSKQKKTA